MSNKDLLPGDEANEPETNDTTNRQNNTKEPEDLLREELYDKQDMLFKFKISSRTLQKWRTKKLIEFLKVEGKIYYPKKYVEEMLRKHRVV